MSDEADELHDRQVKAVAAATAKLLIKLAPQGYSPESIFEGAVKGAAVQLIAARDISLGEAAELLDDVAEGFRQNGEASHAHH